MLDTALILAAMGCWLAASLLAPLLPRTGSQDDRPYLALGLLGALLAIAVSIHVLLTGEPSFLEFAYCGLPARIELDALSAAFLLPLHLVAGLGIVYGRDYWPLASRKGAGRSVRFFFALLVASLSLVFLARQGILFLTGWEGMAICAFFLIGTDHEKPEVKRASWIYLLCTHTGTLLLIAMVVLLAQRDGGLMWRPGQPTSPLDTAILVLALLGFGFKAGLVPLHFWLPEAHAWAPSHVSAILSSVMLKAGIYGFMRVSGLVQAVPLVFGGVLLVVGAITALYGVINALAQGDYKRLLAYSSIENIGIIAMGLGLGWTGRATHQPWIAALGFGGAILHVWNHSVFKSLLFFGAGSLLHATGTRRIDALGGLAPRMPKTALLIFPGVLAVAALPPFNAFLSEWFLYRGFFSCLSQGGSWAVSLALPALALTGGLAAVAFAKFFGFLFLGTPRSHEASHAHDPSCGMWAPMALLAGLCLAMGLGSFALLPLLDHVVAVLAPESVGLLVPGLGWDLQVLAWMLFLLLLVASGCWLWLRPSRREKAERPGTWDCGYAQPTGRMQYTGSSFSDGWAALLPGVKSRIRRIRKLFPKPVAFHSTFQDAVGEAFLEPRVDRTAKRLLRFRQLQQGHLSAYILYILVALLGVFLWMLARPRLLG